MKVNGFLREGPATPACDGVADLWDQLLALRPCAERAVRNRFVGRTPSGGTALSHEDVEDALQVAYSSLWAKCRAGELSQVSHPEKFVALVAVRAAIDLYRHKCGRGRELARPAEQLASELIGIDHRATGAHPCGVEDVVSVAFFLRTVCGLGERAAGVLALLLSGHSPETIVRRLNLTPVSVAKLRVRAVRHLRDWCEKDPEGRERVRFALG
ncbi:MAG: hypothetical protein MUF18_12130 [Fimbriiglobus sp.]|jgi:DNA-directed RNA polymerase specialized sigma24 family protein|nr:hypothetical protein [Fimbriiglobus sp.]